VYLKCQGVWRTGFGCAWFWFGGVCSAFIYILMPLHAGYMVNLKINTRRHFCSELHTPSVSDGKNHQNAVIK
jgi:hypothetical protein